MKKILLLCLLCAAAACTPGGSQQPAPETKRTLVSEDPQEYKETVLALRAAQKRGESLVLEMDFFVMQMRRVFISNGGGDDCLFTRKNFSAKSFAVTKTSDNLDRGNLRQSFQQPVRWSEKWVFDICGKKNVVVTTWFHSVPDQGIEWGSP